MYNTMYVCVYVQNIADPSLVEDPAKDKQFAESAVDTMRVQKDEVWLLQLAYVTFHNVLTWNFCYYSTKRYSLLLIVIL